jgi:hypothetical protein
MLKINEAIYVETQSAHGTPATPTTSNAVLCSNLNFSFTDARMHDRSAIVKNTKGTLAQIHGGMLGQLTFDVDLKGSGTAGTAPEYNDLLVCSGMAETVVASTSVTYAPATSGQKYLTIYFMQDGVRRILEDAVCTWSLTLETGAPGKFSFTVIGHLGTASDTAFGAGTYQASVPPVVKCNAFTIGGYSADITALSLDRGNNIVKPASMSAADGFGQIRIANWDITGSFDALATTLATNDWVGDWEAGTSMALSSGTIGSTAGNRIALSAPAVSYRAVAYADREAERAYENTFACAEDSGDDEISLVFT